MSSISDLTIIGGGPVGLFGAFYSGMRGMTCTIIDSLPQLGGQLAALYPKKYIYDVPGYTKIISEHLVKELEAQARQFDPNIYLNERVTGLKYDETDDSIVQLTTDQGRVHKSKSVVIAAGAGAFLPKKLDLQKTEELEGRGFYYFVKNAEQFRDQEVLIIGGGDSAIDWALMLDGVAKKITLIHRRNGFSAHEDSIAKLNSSSVEIKLPYELKALHGSEKVEGVTILDKEDGSELEFNVTAVICSIGFITNLGPIKEWGLELEGNAIKVNQLFETNLTRVWGAGDIITYPGKLKLIATGFADAATAVNMAKHYLDPKAKVYPGKSSAKKKVFKV